MPNEQQIALCKKNVNNMMDFVNHFHDYAQDKINTAYDLISENPNTDPGEAWIANIIESAMKGVGSLVPGIGPFLANFLSGMLDGYVKNPPPSLKGVFAQVWDRFDKTFLQANQDLSDIYADPASHWNDSFTNPANGQVVKVSDWGDSSKPSMPAKDDPQFQTMTDQALNGFEVATWQEVLPARYHKWITSADPTFFPDSLWNGGGSMQQWAADFTQKYHPAYWVYYERVDVNGNCCSAQHGNNVWEYWLGANATIFSDASAPKNLCDYLFKDDGQGNTTNPDGLAMRADVMNSRNGWKLTSKTLIVASSVPPPEEMAEEDAEHIRQALAKEGRGKLMQAAIKRAQTDPTFRSGLIHRTRETLAKEMNIHLPEQVNLHVLQETPDTFYVVIPWELPDDADQG